MIIYLNTLPTEPEESGSVTRILDVSSYTNCITNIPCAEECGCLQYYMPFIDGDIFYYQFSKSIESVYAVVGETEIDFSSWILSDQKTIGVDCSEVGENCFWVKVVFSDTTECCFEFGFKKVYNCDIGGEKTLLVYSKYGNLLRDCLGNSYENGIYSNQMRIYAVLQYTGIRQTEVEKDENENTISRKTRHLYRLIFRTYFEGESYMGKQFLQSILGGQKIYVHDGNKTYIFDTFNGEVARLSNSTLFMPSITLVSDACESEFLCNQ